jgi:hypothetical protein
MGTPIIQRTFSAGEIAPVLVARADVAKIVAGLRTCHNFFVRREGGASNRAGLRFVAAAKTATAGTRLMRFVSSTAGFSVLIEMGSSYFRFFHNGVPVTLAGVSAWSAIVNYVPGDIVVSGGINYYCITANLNDVPPSANWYAMPGALLEIPTPYSLSQLPKWNQSGNVITLTDPNVTPRELVFVTLTTWILRPVTTLPVSQPPTAPGSTGGYVVPAWVATVNYQPGAIVVNAGTKYTCVQANINLAPPNAIYWQAQTATQLDRIYVITTLLDPSLEESVQSASTTVTGFLAPTITAPNVITWTPPAGLTVDSYNVYVDPYGNGIFGFIGNTSAATFNDTGTPPDFNAQPPSAVNLFQNVNERPSCAANYQQRRYFADSFLEPDRLDGSKTGFPSNFGTSTPLQDDDALRFRLAGNNHHPIRWMVGLKAGLILLTDGGEWSFTGGGGTDTPITPSSVNARQETYNGVSTICRPVAIGNSIVYVQARGNLVREIAFDQSVALGLAGADLTIFSTHLFEGQTIVATDYAQVPDSIVWGVRSDGVLLGLTYIREQQVLAWHRHDTDGLFEDVCVVPEGSRDVAYFLVSRTVGGVTVRYIESLASRVIRPGFFDADSFFVDAGLSYSGAPASSFAGLGHLEGRIVAMLGDGAVVYDGDPAGAQAAAFTVTGGVITPPATVPPTLWSNVHIGLPIRFAEIESLDLDLAGQPVRDKQKAVHNVTLLIDQSAPYFSAGPDSTQLVAYDPTSEPWKSAVRNQTGQYEVNVPTTFSPYGRIFIRQTKPLPLTILALIPNAELGG